LVNIKLHILKNRADMKEIGTKKNYRQQNA
jgi:hypothetical protein